MARSKPKQSTEWKGFANVPFNAAERMQYEAANLTEGGIHQGLEDLIATGYRVSFNYDAKNDCAQCSVTCVNEKDPNAGYTMTSRGPSWWDALSVLVFKHYTLCNEVWPHADGVAGDKWG